MNFDQISTEELQAEISRRKQEEKGVKAKDWLYMYDDHYDEDADEDADEDGEVSFYLVHKRYHYVECCVYDGTIDYVLEDFLPKEFKEDMESHFSIESNRKDAEKKLEDVGIERADETSSMSVYMVQFANRKEPYAQRITFNSRHDINDFLKSLPSPEHSNQNIDEYADFESFIKIVSEKLAKIGDYKLVETSKYGEDNHSISIVETELYNSLPSYPQDPEWEGGEPGDKYMFWTNERELN